MRIACCTMEMITLIFLLFWSLNGAFSVLDAPSPELVSRPASELVAAWGAPERVTAATDLGFRSDGLETVEIWSYDHPSRSVVVRNNVVVSIRTG